MVTSKKLYGAVLERAVHLNPELLQLPLFALCALISEAQWFIYPRPPSACEFECTQGLSVLVLRFARIFLQATTAIRILMRASRVVKQSARRRLQKACLLISRERIWILKSPFKHALPFCLISLTKNQFVLNGSARNNLVRGWDSFAARACEGEANGTERKPSLVFTLALSFCFHSNKPRV